MIHARKDYQRFQDPVPPELGGIPVDEPVMLFRAQDKHALAVLQAYCDAVNADPNVNVELVDSVLRHITRFEKWRDHSRTKSPDMPTGSMA